MNPLLNSRKSLTRAQYLLLYLVMTAAIATGLALFSSASTILALLTTATDGLFLPLLLSLILTFLLQPLVQLVERDYIGRTASIFIVYAFVAVLFALAVSWIVPYWQGMMVSLKADLPRYTARMVGIINEFQATLQSRLPLVERYDLHLKVRSSAEDLMAQILVQTPRSAMRLGSLLILVPLFTFFFLRDGNRFMRACIALAPNRNFEMVHDLYYRVSRQLSQFIRGRLLEAFIIGLVVGIGLSFTEIRYIPFLAVFAGATNLIPYIGPIVGMIPGLLIALVDLGMGGQFWWILAVYVLIAQVVVDNFILIPILISRVSNLHPLIVILAIIMGGKLYGILGMIIGVPVASILTITLQEIRHYRRTFALPESSADFDRTA